MPVDLPLIGTFLDLHAIVQIENWQERLPEIATAIEECETLESIRSITTVGNTQSLITYGPIIEAIVRNGGIKRISLYYHQLNSTTLGRILREMQNLEALFLAGTRFVDPQACARVIQNGCKKLKRLQYNKMGDVDSANYVAIAVARALRFRSSLKSFRIHGKLTQDSMDAMADALQSHSSLDNIVISDDHICLSEETADKFALAIESNSLLKEFVLKVKTIPGDSCLRLLQSLTRNSNLETAVLEGMNVDENLQSHVAIDVLEENWSLSTLKIAGFKVVDEEREQGGVFVAPMASLASPVASLLAKFQSLKHLDLGNLEMSLDGTQALCDVLEHNRKIEKVVLNGLRVHPKAMERASSFLSECSTLTEFTLKNMQLDDDESLVLFMSLAKNKALKFIEFQTCQMSEIGFAHIPELLLNNDSLETLYFNDVVAASGDNEALFMNLGDALKRNKELKQLVISTPKDGRPLSSRGVDALLSGLSHHQKLQLHLFTFNGMSQSQRDELAFYNERNKKFCPLLNLDPPLPLGMWPRILSFASSSQASTRTPLDMLYFLVKQKSDLFQWSRSTDNSQSSKPTVLKRKRPTRGEARSSKRTRKST